ncbi:MAG: response regulator [Leptolyngbya sp.]|nr:response regulator [Candidatus Melainabacteria bacterium]
METQLTTGFGVMLGLATFMFGAFFFIASTSINNELKIEKRHEYLANLRATREAMYNAESLTRAFLLEPQPKYANEVNTVASTIPQHIQNLQSNITDWYETRNLTRLNDISGKRINALLEIIHARKEKGVSAALPLMRAYDESDERNILQTLVSRLEASEQEHLQNQRDETRNVIPTTAWVFSLLGLFVFSGFFYLVRRMYSGISYRRHIEDEAARKAEELSKLNEKLIQSERIKSEFVATVSHELRTPLTLILAPLESILAGDAGKISNEQRGHMNTMHNNTVRLLQLISGLLDFSRLEAGRIEMRPEATNINELTQSILSDFSPATSQKQIELITNFPATATNVEIDRYVYERILFNLVSNAVKFTPVGGNVVVTIDRKGTDSWTLSVKDNGIGIPEADIELIFHRFRQAEAPSTRRFEGAGLGLALVVEFSRLLNGKVEVESKPGEGSTFSVDFVAAESRLTAGDTTRNKSQSLVPQYPTETNKTLSVDYDDKPLVLVAEDNTELSAYISSVLESFCRVNVAKNGRDALDLVRLSPPDLILSDIMMPEMDGLTLCKEIKADPLYNSIPVILLTALTNRDALLRGWESGADEYLFKPFHPKELTTRIKGMLAGVEERKRSAELQLQQQKTLLAKDFMSTLAHDMQVPLLGSSRVFDMLLGGQLGKMPEEITTLIGQIQERNKFLLKLTDCLLEIYRYESDSKDLLLAPVALDEIAKEVVVDFAEIAAEKQIVVQEHLEPNVPKISADSRALKLLITHLLDNAIKYGANSGKVSITVEQEHDELALSVFNSGSFIDDESKKNLFDKFWRGQPGKRFVANTGLGLYLCKRIVDAHGGIIECLSDTERGTTLKVTLPVNNKKVATKLSFVPGDKAETK